MGESRKWPRGISPNGNGIRIRLWRNGKEVYSETVAGDPYSTGDLAAAVKRREELASRLRLGLPLTTGENSTAALFADEAQDYLNTLEADYSTALSYEGIINRYWLPAFGNWMVSDIKAGDIKRELAKYPALSSKTKKNVLIPLRGIFKHAMDAGHATVNPVAAVKLKKHQKPSVDRFLPKERDKILAKLEGQPLVYFTLFFATGMRPGELLGLKWGDWDGDRFRVHQSIVRRRLKRTTKTHEARRVYVPKWARPVLLAHATRFAGEWLFLNSHARPCLDTDVFNSEFRIACKRAKVPYRIPYTCRHTRAAEMLSAGVEPGKAAAELGHSLEMFYRIYAQWIDEYGRNDDMSRLEGQSADRLKTGLDSGA